MCQYFLQSDCACSSLWNKKITKHRTIPLNLKKNWKNEQSEVKIIQSNVNILADMSSISQSIPSSKLTPVTALHCKIFQWWVLISSNSKTSFIAALERAPGRSCLLQNISRVAPANL